jgi:hypothetical protein
MSISLAQEWCMLIGANCAGRKGNSAENDTQQSTHARKMKLEVVLPSLRFESHALVDMQC